MVKIAVILNIEMSGSLDIKINICVPVALVARASAENPIASCQQWHLAIQFGAEQTVANKFDFPLQVFRSRLSVAS